MAVRDPDDLALDQGELVFVFAREVEERDRFAVHFLVRRRDRELVVAAVAGVGEGTGVQAAGGGVRAVEGVVRGVVGGGVEEGGGVGGVGGGGYGGVGGDGVGVGGVGAVGGVGGVGLVGH